MLAIFYVGIGGFFGAILRYLVGVIFTKFCPTNFAYATLFVNMVGSFLIGLFLSYSLNSSLRNFLVVGVLGAFTTFSTFSYESLIYLNSGEFLKFGLNIFLNLSLSLIFCFLGLNFIEYISS